MVEKYGIPYDKLLTETKLIPGQQVRLVEKNQKGEIRRSMYVKVAKRYRHHVLLDFGKYKESRRIADIALGLAEI